MKRGREGGVPLEGRPLLSSGQILQRRDAGPMLAELSYFQKPEVCITSSSLVILTLRVKQIPFVESKKGSLEKPKVDW